MKPIRTLLLFLCSLVSFWAEAQQGTQTFVLVPATGYNGTPYQVTFTRPESDFPLGSTGVNLAKRAVLDGKLNLRVISSGTYSGTTYTATKFYASCYIAAGTKPGLNPPNCAFTSTIVTPPTTTTTTITIPAVNQSFAAADGSGTGSDIGLGYYGGYTDNSQYRQFSYSAPVTAGDYNLAIHYKTNTQTTGKGNIVVNGSTNVEFDLEGAEGGTRTTYRNISLNQGSNTIRLEGKSGTTYFFDNLFLTRAASTSVVTTTTGTDPTPTTSARSYSNVIVAGNSITDYGQGKGYDASSADKDYLHILTAKLKTLNANVQVRTFKDFQGGALTDGPYFETDHGKMDNGLSRFAAAAASKPDLLFISLGENVKDATNYGKDLIDLVAAITAQSPNCVVVIRTTIWGKTDIDTIIQQTAAQKGWIFVDARNITGARSGNDFHPNDQAMATIADLFWSATPKGTVTTTPPSTTTAVAGNVDAQGFLIYQDQGWSGSDVKRIENSEMFLEFKRSVGACVTAAGLKSNNRNVTNDEQVRPNGGPQISDKGVQWQVSPYAHPSGGQPLTISGETRGGTGDNPVQGGSANPYFQPGIVEKSAIIQTADRGVVFCARGRGILWDWFSVAGHMPYDIEWWFLPGNVITYKVRLTIEPRPSTWSGLQKFQSVSQELLCLYNIGAFNNHVARINGSEVNLRDGVALGGQSNDYFTSECWAATYQPDRSQGVLYYTPRNSIFKSWQKVAESGEWPDPGMSYINASLKRTYDIAGTQTIDNGYIILGSQNTAMARMAQLEPIDQTYDFDFTSLNNQWWNEDARVMRNSNGSLRYYCGDEKTDNGQTNTFGRFLSPARAWQASQFKNVEFDMAVNGVNRILLKWAKPGRFGQYEYSKEVTVTGDGTRRTYQFQLEGMPNWNGTITYLGLQAIVPATPSAYIDMYRARKFAMGGFGEVVLMSLAAGMMRRRRKSMPARQLKPVSNRKSIRITQ